MVYKYTDRKIRKIISSAYVFQLVPDQSLSLKETSGFGAIKNFDYTHTRYSK